MKSPPTLDDINRPPDGDDRDDWARWERTFRDARPVLPEAAVERIERTIQSEVQRTRGAPDRRKTGLILLLAILFVVAVAALCILERRPHNSVTGMGGDRNSPAVHDRYPLLAPPLTRRVTPTTSALPLAGESEAVVSAAAKSIEEGITVYRGPVQVSVGEATIRCQKLTLFRGSEPQGRLLSGAGPVEAVHVSGVEQIISDEFTFNTATGVFSFTGKVQVTRAGARRSCSSCTISRTGAVLLDGEAR